MPKKTKILAIKKKQPKPKNANKQKRGQIKGKGPYDYYAYADGDFNFLGQSVKLGGGIKGSGPYKRMGGGRTAPQVPYMHSAGDGFTVRHREYIGDLLSTTNFGNNSFNVNPGDLRTFPWLSSLATRFEEYKFTGLAFEFISTSGVSVASANTALGAVIHAAEYNVYNVDFTNKISMENCFWSRSHKPSDSCIMPIECDSKANPVSILYVRNGQAASDRRLYDLATYQIATMGQQTANVNLGEIWVTYDVTLFKPVLVNGFMPPGRFSHFRPADAVTSGDYKPFYQPTEIINELGITIPIPQTLRFPPHSSGKYVLTYTSAHASPITATGTIYIAGVGFTPLPMFNGGSSAFAQSAITGEYQPSVAYAFSVADSAEPLELNWILSYILVNCKWDLIVTSLPSSAV